MQPQTNNLNSNLDPQAVNLAKAIRQIESSGNHKARGKSGEYGAYQFTPDTWASTSKKYGVNVPLENSTLVQQNEVAYKQIKEWKDKGYDVGQIASMWNAGEGKPNAHLEGMSGTNSYGAKYDVSAYAKSVANTYQTIKRGGQVQMDNSTPSSVQPETYGNFPQQVLNPEIAQQEVTPEQPARKSLWSKLGGRLTDIGSNVSDIVAPLIGGQAKQNIASNVLQGVGALAGGVNDVTTSALENIPIVGGVVRGAEDLVGKGVGALADTEAGKSAVQGIQEFQQNHPEASKNIEAGLNIATAVPILKGVGVAKNIVGGSLAKFTGKELASIVADVSPEVTKETVKQGLVKTVKKGFKGTIGAEVSPEIKSIATAISELVPNYSRLKTFTEKIDALTKIIDDVTDPKIKIGLTTAIENMLPKTFEELGTTGFQRFMRSHPTLKNVIGVGKNAAIYGTGAGGAYGLYQSIFGK